MISLSADCFHWHVKLLFTHFSAKICFPKSGYLDPRNWPNIIRWIMSRFPSITSETWNSRHHAHVVKWQQRARALQDGRLTLFHQQFLISSCIIRTVGGCQGILLASVCILNLPFCLLMKGSMTSRTGHDGPGQLITLYLNPAMSLIQLVFTCWLPVNVDCSFCSQVACKVKYK